jgi:dinuclear metal center YbgI/SA1388 family protein
MSTVAALVESLQQLAPLDLAQEWDNVGLLWGDASAPVERLMTCLTVTPETAAEAIEARAELIVTHHPILFRPIQRLTTATSEGRMLLALARAGVAIYSPHTAFDNAPGGINDILARRLGLTELRPLRRGDGKAECKVVVFVPDSDLAKVADAIFSAGAGHIGQYRECSFRLAGTGTFFGSDATNPTVGQKGRREEVNEWRLEAVCPASAVDRVIAAMRRAHSYEEPAYDVYPLRPTSSKHGAGRVGKLPKPCTLQELSQVVKDRLSAPLVQIVGTPSRKIETVAIACGAGGEMLPDAVSAGADVFLTGELRFHDLLKSEADGVALLLPGHYATERCGIEELANCVKERWPDLHIWPSRREHDPLTTAG